MQISADNVSNLNGRIEGNKVGITTMNDLNNIGGQIKANDAMALKVGGNLNISTTTSTSNSQVGGFSSTITNIDRVAGLYVGNGTNVDISKATLVVDVGGNTVLKGAQIVNSNGASIITTKGDVDIGTVQTGYKFSSYTDEKNHYSIVVGKDHGSTIGSVGSTIITGDNIHGKAVNLSSQEGNVEVYAKNDIKLDIGVQEKNATSQSERKGSFGGKKSSTYEEHQTTSIANQISAGQDIILHSQQGDITATYLKGNAGKNIQILAETGNVELLSSIDEKSVSSTSSKKNAATYNNRQSGYIDQEAAQTTLKAGGTVDINAGKNIELQANDIEAGKSIYVGNTLMQRQEDGTLKAADGSLMPENVSLTTLETHDQQWDEQQKGYRGIAKELVKGLAMGVKGLEGLAPGLEIDGKLTVGESSTNRSEQIKQTGTSLNANNVAIGSSGKTTLTSVDITADNAIISGQKVVLNAAEEKSIRSESQSKETIEGLGVKLNQDNIRVGGFTNEDKTQSTKLLKQRIKRAVSILRT